MCDSDLERDMRAFSQTIAGANPILVPYEPTWWAVPNRCFNNVSNQIFLRGGLSVIGWQFSRDPLGTSPAILSAIQHAIWRSEDGRLVDITPVDSDYLMQGDSLIWFLPDDRATLKLLRGSDTVLGRPSRYFSSSEDRGVQRQVHRLRELEKAARSAVNPSAR
jgi:hypothetical protein